MDMANRKPRRRSPNALGTIRQNKSGRYSASYRIGDKTYRAPRTFSDRAGAEAWLGRERADLHLGVWRDPERGQTTLGAYASEWLELRRDLAPRTKYLYEQLAQRWLFARVADAHDAVHLGEHHLSSLTPALLRRWLAVVAGVSHAGATARLERRRARRPHPARAWAIDQGIPVAPTGRLSPALVAGWEAAGCPTPSPGSYDVPTERRQAGRTQTAHAFRLLRAILNTAVADGLLESNPALALRGAGTVHHRERGTASPSQVAALAEAVPVRLRAAIILAAWSGLRSGEVLALARRHLDLTEGTVRVERSLVAVAGRPVTFGEPKTPKSRRLVHLPGFVVDELRSHLVRFVPLGPDQLVFTTPSGDPLTGAHVSRAFRRARATIGREDLTFHDLRHTAALAAYAVGATQRAVQDRLGHSTPRAAAIYAHAHENADAMVANKLDEYGRTAGGSR